MCARASSAGRKDDAPDFAAKRYDVSVTLRHETRAIKPGPTRATQGTALGHQRSDQARVADMVAHAWRKLTGRVAQKQTLWFRPKHTVKQDGTIAAHYRCDSFGNVTSGDTSKTRYLFTSREFDTATKLQYNRARWYDAGVGRWINEDPLGFAAGDGNVGRYVRNEMTGTNDSSGLEWVWPWNPDAQWWCGMPKSRNSGGATVYRESGDTLKQDVSVYSGVSATTSAGMVLAGQRIRAIKPVGMRGSTPGSSVASWGFRKVLPKAAGRLAGRAVPVVGWTTLAADALLLSDIAYCDWQMALNAQPLPPD